MGTRSVYAPNHRIGVEIIPEYELAADGETGVSAYLAVAGLSQVYAKRRLVRGRSRDQQRDDGADPVIERSLLPGFSVAASDIFPG